MIQLADSELGIGHEAWSYLSEEDPGTLNIFSNGVREQLPLPLKVFIQ